jgi:hypothetical protein
VTEAVFGQLYLITVVSLVVQNLGAKRQQQRESGSAPSSGSGSDNRSA